MYIRYYKTIRPYKTLPVLLDEMENRRDAIIAYIVEHDGCIKAQVIEHMLGQSAVATSHRIIKELISDQTILVRPDKKNRQIHHLHYNDKFATMDNEINEIKKLMDLMDEPINRYLKLEPQDVPLPTEASLPKLEGDTVSSRRLEDPDRDKKYTNRDDINTHFIYPYYEAVTMMLQILFKRIGETVLSEKDADKFRRRLLILLLRLTTQIYHIENERGYLDLSIWWLKTFRLPTTKQFAKRKRIDIGIRKEIIEIIQMFEQKFLS